MAPAHESPVTHVFSVRGRPVGFRPSRFGGELVATERGDFPVSSTGYRSLAGQFGGGPGHHDLIAEDFLEALAAQRDREREQLRRQLHEAVKPVGSPVANYVHVSIAFERAVQDGFFSTDRDRTALWSGAHYLLCLVDTDPRFQPMPHPGYPAWGKSQCEKSHAFARSLLALLKRLATGDMPAQLPVRLLGPSAYLGLPPKPRGEPRIDLGGFIAEMRLDVAPTLEQRSSVRRRPEPVGFRPDTPATAETQLGLFDSLATPTVRTSAPAHTPRVSI